MAQVGLPKIFQDDTPLFAAELNANNTAIIYEINGHLVDANIDEISEKKIVFDDADGHDHSGGANGKLIPVPYAIDNGKGGAIKMQHGVANGIGKNGGVAEIHFDPAFQTIPAITAYVGFGGDWFSLTKQTGDAPPSFLYNIDEEGFGFCNQLNIEVSLYWIALGVLDGFVD